MQRNLIRIKNDSNSLNESYFTYDHENKRIISLERNLEIRKIVSKQYKNGRFIVVEEVIYQQEKLENYFEKFEEFYDFVDRDLKDAELLEYNFKDDISILMKNDGINIRCEHIPAKEVKDKEETISEIFRDIQAGPFEELKQKGFWIVGTDMNGTDYDKIDYNGSIGIVIGNEGNGMSRLVRENCDFIASIPMRGTVNSLNASVAAGIMIYEVVRNRK